MRFGERKSLVWNYFDQPVQIRNSKLVLCRICNKQFKFFRNTANLKRHLKNKHHIEFQQQNVQQKVPQYIMSVDGNVHYVPEKCDEKDEFVVEVVEYEVDDSTTILDANEDNNIAVSVTTSDIDPLTLPTPKHKRYTNRSVWNYFDKPQGIKDAKFVLCRLCTKKIKFLGNTTNMKQHLIRIHQLCKEETVPIIDDKSKLTMEVESVPSLSKLSSNSPPKYEQLKVFNSNETRGLSELKKRTLDMAIIKIMVSECQETSLSFVENKHFLEYTKELEPLYSPPSKELLISKLLPELYTDVSSDLRLILNSVDHLSVTMDMWLSDCNKSYLTITSHFIFNDQLHAKVLATKEVYMPHSATNIALVLSDTFKEWAINDKIVTIVSDNKKNIKNAVIEHLSKFHNPCVANTFNMSINNALTTNEMLMEVIGKCETLVAYFKHNMLASQTLIETQEQMNFPVLKVKQHLASKWNSCLTMMERLSEIKDPLAIAVNHLAEAPTFLDEDDWSIVSDCILLLKPLEIMTSELSKEKYPSMSFIIPLIRGLQYTIRNEAPETTTGESLRETLLHAIDKRLCSLETNKVAAKATFLDPRFKKTAFGSKENANNAEDWIVEELTQMITKKNSFTSDPTMKFVEETNDNGTDKISLWSLFDRKVSEEKSIVTTETTVALLIRQYVEMPHLSRTQNPLDFWKIHRNSMPELYCLQSKYLCIPGTAVPSDRVFGKAGHVTNVRMDQLSTLDQIVFLNSNYL